MYLDLEFSQPVELASQRRKDAILDLFSTRALDVLPHLRAIDFLDIHGLRHIERIQDFSLKLAGSRQPVTESAGFNLLVGPLETGLSYTSSRVLGLYFDPVARAVLQDSYAALLSFHDLEVDTTHAPSLPQQECPDALAHEALGSHLSSRDLALLKSRSAGFMTFPEYLTSEEANTESYFLGLSYYNGLLTYLQSRFPIQGPRDSSQGAGFYSKWGVVPGEKGHTEKIMSALLAGSRTVYFFVPPNVMDPLLFFVTRREMEYLLSQSRFDNVKFVWGAYAAVSRGDYYGAGTDRNAVLELYGLRAPRHGPTCGDFFVSC